MIFILNKFSAWNFKCFIVIISLTLVIGAAIPYLVSKIINIDVGDPQATEARLKVISTVMKVIGDFSKAIKDMMSLMPKANDMAEVKKNAETMFEAYGHRRKIRNTSAGKINRRRC